MCVCVSSLITENRVIYLFSPSHIVHAMNSVRRWRFVKKFYFLLAGLGAYNKFIVRNKTFYTRLRLFGACRRDFSDGVYRNKSSTGVWGTVNVWWSGWTGIDASTADSRNAWRSACPGIVSKRVFRLTYTSNVKINTDIYLFIYLLLYEHFVYLIVLWYYTGCPSEIWRIRWFSVVFDVVKKKKRFY